MKRNLLFTVFIIHTFIKLSSQENVLNCTMLKQYVFVNAPKEWFKYVAKYLQVKVSRRYLNLKEIYIFLRNKTSKIDVKIIYFATNTKHRERTALHPLGLVTSYRERFNSVKYSKVHFKNYMERKIVEDKISFSLDKKLCLNLTFLHIHFEFRKLHTCSVGEVRVVSHSKHNQVFRYCGIHSNMIHYPQNRNVSIFLPKAWTTNSMTGIHNVIIFYSVIDTKRIVNLQKYILLSRNLMWNLYLIPKNIRVMKFALRARKYQHLIITFTNHSKFVVELYDGPGTHSSNIFKNNNESHVTSTFQSIIYLWIPFAKRLNAGCGLEFVTESSSVKMNIQLNDSLPHKISHAFMKYEVWRILSYYNVNLTIINLTYTGFNDPLCTFAGITAYSLNKDSYTETTTECNVFNNVYSMYRDIYSKTNETLLAFYSYKEYGNFSLTMQFSTTQCKPVIINTCALSYLCKFHNNVMCREHREQIRLLHLKQTEISTDFPISVNPGHCFVVQMVAVADRLRIRRLADYRIDFHHINISDRRIDIHFNIKAFIQGMFLLTVLVT